MTSGHDERWSDEKDAETIGFCLICTMIPRDAVAHACGQLFCQGCWSTWQSTGRGCSQCRQPGNADPAHKDRRAVLNLKIYCPTGCGAIMSLCEKQRHQETLCLHRRVNCPSCQDILLLSHLTQHMSLECRNREIKCHACNLPTTPLLLTLHQRDECPARNVKCTLCQELVPSSSLGSHMSQASDTHFLALAQALSKREAEVAGLRTEVLECRLMLAAQASEIMALKSSMNQEHASWRHGQRQRGPPGERKTATRHTGRIGATPNGISRLDGEYNIFWNKEVTRNPVAGYVFENFRYGWKEPLAVVYSESRWSCCGQPYDAEGCGY